MSQNVLKYLYDNQLSCPVCLSKFKKPIILNCGHCYCWKCIFVYINRYNCSKCPNCRQDVDEQQLKTAQCITIAQLDKHLAEVCHISSPTLEDSNDSIERTQQLDELNQLTRIPWGQWLLWRVREAANNPLKLLKLLLKSALHLWLKVFPLVILYFVLNNIQNQWIIVVRLTEGGLYQDHFKNKMGDVMKFLANIVQQL